MKIFRNEDGQTLVLTALCMTAMLGFMALAIDVGLLFRARRNMQITADAVAVAAALDYYYGYVDTMAKQTPADLRSYADKYIIGKPRVVGVLLSPEARRAMKLSETELLERTHP